MSILNPKIPYEQLRILLSQHISSAPSLSFKEELSEADLLWIGKAETLIDLAGNPILTMDFRSAKDKLGTYGHNRNDLMLPLISAHTLVELKCPVGSQGLFIEPGQSFQGYSAVVRILSQESSGFLVVDPYLNGQTVCDLVPHVLGGTAIHFLTTSIYRESIDAALNKWRTDKPKLEEFVSVKYAAKGELHDRLIVCRPSTIWLVSQSLKDIAKKSPATLTQPDEQTGEMKIDFYSKLWSKLESN
ncbi:MAG: hypothetical protein ABJN65_03305 [Parasphingorhabdus sp.]